MEAREGIRVMWYCGGGERGRLGMRVAWVVSEEMVEGASVLSVEKVGRCGGEEI